MVAEQSRQAQSSYAPDLVVRGCGLYERDGGKVDGVPRPESYLYSPFEEYEQLPSKKELEALKGKRVWRTRKNKREKVQEPSRVYLPLIVDTEYQTLPNRDKYPEFFKLMVDKLQRINRGSMPLTVQFNTIRPTGHGIGTMVHPSFTAAFPRARPNLPTPKNPLEGYLQMLFPEASVQECQDFSHPTFRAFSNKRVLRLDLFAHFAVADLWKMWPAGPVHDHLIKLATKEDPTIHQKRHTEIERTFKLENGHSITRRWEKVPAIVKIHGIPFVLEISVIDTSAMAGQAGFSLERFHMTAGEPLVSKDNYAKHHKELMLLQFAASCDPIGVEKGVYNDVSKALPGKLNEALIHCEAYSTGNLFIDYAEGDVDLYTAVHGFDRQFFSLYESLGLDQYFRSPKRTVGSTVHALLQAAVLRLFETDGPIDPKQKKFILENGFEPARSKGLAEKAQWAAANARVFGGRVLSTAPTLISRKNASVCDMDLAGAYARSMDIQILPIGRPVIDQKFTRRSKRNEYPTLKGFLKDYERHFVPGCWQALISCELNGKPIELPIDQDYFASWKTPVIFEGDKLLENDNGLWQERFDDVTVYTRQITNTVLTHDGLQWLRYCASKELRAFILNNAIVKASLYYPKECRVSGDDPQEFLSRLKENENDGRKNTCKVKIRKQNASVEIKENEDHTWMGVTVADLLTTALTAERDRWKQFTKQYDLLNKKGITCVEQLSKLTEEERERFDYLANEHEGGHNGGTEGLIEASVNGGKHPKDELAKLCGNTVYGDLVSRFFALSNPAVGNNITARVRSIIWYFEKSCRAWNSITDGGLFDLNEVNVARTSAKYQLNEKNTMFSVTDQVKKTTLLGVTAKPLGYDNPDPILAWGWNGDRVTLKRESGTYELEVKAAQTEIDQLTMEHVQNSFSHKIDVINPRFIMREGKLVGLFEFEAKGVVKDAATHGTANYCLRGGKHGSYKSGRDWTIKLRSYKEETHEPILKPFFDQLIDNPEAVDRSKYWEPFTQGGILKVGKFASGYVSAYADTILEPGDTEYQIKIFREFTPSAFRFQNQKQREAFVNFHQSHRDLGNHRKDTYGAARGQSFESYFTDENGVLNYKLMMSEVENAVRDGRNMIHPELQEVDEHPMKGKALDMKRSLWKSLVLEDRRYETVSDTIQGDFELLHEDDFYVPEGY